MTMRRQKFLLFRVYQFRDTQAYGEIYDVFYAKIRRYIFFKLPSEEEVDELTAEVFLRGWEFATASKVENASALFYRIARNLIADFYRQRRETLSLEENQIEFESKEKLAENVASKLESAELIKQLKRLKDEYREVLVMKYLNEMTTSEIATALDKSANNVRVTLHRAKKALREISK